MNKLKNFTNPLFLIAYFLTLFVINFVDINLLKFDGFPMDNPYQLLLTLLTTLIFINSYNDQNLNLNLLFLTITLSTLFIGLNFYLNHKSEFTACYKTDFTTYSNLESSFVSPQECQFSYNNIGDPNITRKEKHINFYSVSENLGTGIEFTNWNLHFFNQTGFNFYDKNFYNFESDSSIKHWWGKDLDNSPFGPLTMSEFKAKRESKELEDFFGLGIVYIENEPSRSWLPFSVEFKGQKPTVYDQDLKVQYTGELVIYVDNKPYIFETEYRKIKTKTIFIPKNSNLKIDYKYRYSPVVGNHPGAPYAHLRILNDDMPAKLFNKSLTLNDDLLSAILFFSILISFYLSLITRESFKPILLAIVIYYFCNEFIPERVQGLILFTSFLVIIMKFYDKEKSTFFHIYFFSFLTTILTTRINNFNFVKYTYGGGDALKYESWAQEIIIQKSLRAGEDIFFYMPGYRYLISLLRVFVGDSHNSISVLYSFLVIVLLYLIFSNRKAFNNNLFFKSIFVVSIYVIMFSFSVKSNVLESYSEWPTWIIFLLFIHFINKNGKNNFLLILPFLLVLFRQNQLIGAIFLVALLIQNKKSHFTISVSAASLLIFFFPFLHNFYYGGKFTFYKDPFESGAYYITPIELLKHLFFIDKSDSVKFHIDFLFANQFNQFVRELGGPVLLSLLNIYLLMFVIIVIVKIYKKSFDLNFVLQCLMVSGFLLVHLIYQVHTYYPRHIIIGYLALIYVTLSNFAEIYSEKNKILFSKNESIDDSNIT